MIHVLKSRPQTSQKPVSAFADNSPGQCIMKKAPASEGRSWMWGGLRTATAARRVTAVLCVAGKSARGYRQIGW